MGKENPEVIPWKLWWWWWFKYSYTMLEVVFFKPFVLIPQPNCNLAWCLLINSGQLLIFMPEKAIKQCCYISFHSMPYPRKSSRKDHGAPQSLLQLAAGCFTYQVQNFTKAMSVQQLSKPLKISQLISGQSLAFAVLWWRLPISLVSAALTWSQHIHLATVFVIHHWHH